MTGPQALQHPRFARTYLKISRVSERRGGAEHRRRLLAGLTGRVLEIGAGQGNTFRYYPQSVAEVVAVEPEDTLRAYAQQAATTAPVPVTVVAGHARELPGAESEFDAAVVSLVLCSVDDPAAALAEIARVVRPGGELRFYEHVRSTSRWAAPLEEAITPLWRRAAGGCHPNRDTVSTIRAAGFTVGHVDRFGFSFAPLAPPIAHVIGTAIRR